LTDGYALKSSDHKVAFSTDDSSQPAGNNASSSGKTTTSIFYPSEGSSSAAKDEEPPSRPRSSRFAKFFDGSKTAAAVAPMPERKVNLESDGRPSVVDADMERVMNMLALSAVSAAMLLPLDSRVVLTRTCVY
jgi:hypothetical protein